MTAAPARTILYVHSSDEMYGADLILLQLVTGLPPGDFRPIVVVPTDVAYTGLLTTALRDHGITVLHHPTAVLRRSYFTPLGALRYLWRFGRSVRFLLGVIRRERVALVHSNTVAVLPGAVAARLARVPHVWHVHEIITSPRPLWRGTAWLLPRLSRRAVAVSGPTRDHLIAGHARNRDHAVVIHNGIDTARFDGIETAAQQVRADWGVAPDQPLVGMVGRVSHWKGQSHFLQAAEHVARRYPAARFALVGGVFPGQEHLLDQLRREIHDRGLDGRVILSDFRRDIPAVLGAFDIFVLPSTAPDPLPTVVLEAMAAGRPVVANAHGGSTEMVADGTTGILVDPADPAALARAVGDLLDDPARRQAMGAAGRRRLDEQFSRRRFLERWQALYDDILKGNR